MSTLTLDRLPGTARTAIPAASSHAAPRLVSRSTQSRTTPLRTTSTRRPVDGRWAHSAVRGVRCAGVRHRQRVIARRRAMALSILAGFLLAVIATVVVLVGTAMNEVSAAPQTGTTVQHVEPGESLTAIAARVAPGVPTEVVIHRILQLNGMTNTALVAGQPLLVPTYQR